MIYSIDERLRAVDRLTLVTKTVVSRRPLVIRDAPPLLAELRAAVHPSGGHSSGSSTPEPGSPLDLGAMELMTSIQDEVNQAYWLVKDATRRPGLGGYTLEERLRFVRRRVAESLDRPEGPGFLPEARPELIEDAPVWVEQIETLFDPPKIVPLAGHACPVCHTERTSVLLNTGERGDAWALSVRFGEPMVASCAECGERWPGRELLDLAAVLGGDTQVMEHVLADQARKRVS